VIRAQAYIDARPGLRLKAHQSSDLTDYLNELGRKSGMKAWQFRQAVEAIWILLVDMAGLDLPFTHKSTRIYTPAQQIPLA
jgi:hypothetical protein